MKLKNIKASFIFNQDLVEKKSGTGKVHFKEGNVTYTIYKHTPHLLNLTGVKSIGQLKTCKVEMEERFDGEIDMDKLHLYLNEHEKYYATGCPATLFPLLFFEFLGFLGV